MRERPIGFRRVDQSEGFASQEEMDAWFRPLVKPGKSVEKALMLFRRLK